METNFAVESSVPIQEINIKNIKHWNEKRKEESFLKSLFDKEGNKFSFTKHDANIEMLHIYLALDTSGQLNFYFIKGRDDARKRFNWLSAASLSNSKGSLPPVIIESNVISSNQMPYGKAKEWIDNWIDPQKRNEWVETNFNSSLIDNTIMLAFVISTADFNIGAKHECYLALKKVKSKYVADLIVYNTESKEILNKQKIDSSGITSLEVSDLARPVPPFGQEYDEFGVLIELGIK